MAVKYCTKCGCECVSDANFCPKCGNPFNSNQEISNTTREGYTVGGVIDYETKVVMFMGIPTVKYALKHNSELNSLERQGWEIYSVERPEGTTRYIARLRRRRKA